MTDIDFSFEWQTTGNDAPEIKNTMAQLTIRVGDYCLTRNEDTWSKTIKDSILVSAYPLGLWLATSWWRLLFEPLSKQGVKPSHTWRMSHELGAANHGFVWPHVIFASDGDAMQVWSTSTQAITDQSVKYLQTLPLPQTVTLSRFKCAVETFINTVLSRLHAQDIHNTDLEGIWKLIKEDSLNHAEARLRRLEAQLGYDPEECPQSIINQALDLENKLGESTLYEIAPVYGRYGGKPTLDDFSELIAYKGLIGKPEIAPSLIAEPTPHSAPWTRAVKTARNVRDFISNASNQISDGELHDLLGINSAALSSWNPQKRTHVGLAVPTESGALNFIPRKMHPVARRFELARFLADFLLEGASSEKWLASTDLYTSRQKFQRAFAAEFLCPLDGLIGFLSGDFSEAAINEAAVRFEVSEKTIESLLSNNGYITPKSTLGSLPYPISAERAGAY